MPLSAAVHSLPVSKLDPAVGIAIRVARKAARLSRAQLAHACGVTVRHIAAIERGSDFTVARTMARSSAISRRPTAASTAASIGAA